ncbi:MAG TPA: zinc metallopeptidase [Myxococcota bacterium]|nr:zinc metallopeptidase [Myxococcota bacterium]HOD08348.1 zinc metallopeptidase [Myxococcota bacterium]
MIFDPLYLLMLAPALLLSLAAQIKVKSAYARYSKVPASNGMSGAQVARRILDAEGLNSVPVELVPGTLTDHYDPSKRVLRLSEGVYRGKSVAAAGIAAHEVGHAIQHSRSYAPLVLRTTLVPLAQLGSNLSWILIMIGFFVSMTELVWAGIALFGAAVLFTIVTLPVEFNASSRAKEALPRLGLVGAGDTRGVNSVLNAAAMTYVAAAITAILQLVYFIFRASRD